MNQAVEVDIRDIIGDLDTSEKDRYLTSLPSQQVQLLETPDSAAGEEDEKSPFLNLKDVVSLEEFPTPDIVPAVAVKTTEKVVRTKSYKPRKNSVTQRKAYELFMGCLDWFKADESHLFQQEYWAEKGIVQRQMMALTSRYPICQYVAEQIRAVQEARLLNGAATEKLHPGFVKFFLNCRYQDHYIPHTEVNQQVSGSINNTQVNVVFEEVKPNGTNKSIT